MIKRLGTKYNIVVLKNPQCEALQSGFADDITLCDRYTVKKYTRTDSFMSCGVGRFVICHTVPRECALLK